MNSLSSSFFCIVSAGTFCIALAAGISGAQAQQLTATLESAPAVTYVAPAISKVANAPTENMVMTGHVANPSGPLPGAVVRLNGTDQRCVTDAAGNFHLRVPIQTSPVALTASYAGYLDESVSLDPTVSATIRLVNPKPVKVARKQQLKHYLRTARRQGRRNSRSVRRH
jgi:hypothetical protein